MLPLLPGQMIMACYRDIPELLERLMEESGDAERWITVNEFRRHYDLDEFSSPAISGFLRKISQGPFFSFRYRVERIEKIKISKPHRRIIKRYLVTRRPRANKQGAGLFEDPAIDVRASGSGTIERTPVPAGNGNEDRSCRTGYEETNHG